MNAIARHFWAMPHGMIWTFPLEGVTYTVDLSHSHESGKRELSVNGVVLLSHWSFWTILNDDGGTYEFLIGGYRCVARIKVLMTSGGARCTYELTIDGITVEDGMVFYPPQEQGAAWPPPPSRPPLDIVLLPERLITGSQLIDLLLGTIIGGVGTMVTPCFLGVVLIPVIGLSTRKYYPIAARGIGLGWLLAMSCLWLMAQGMH